MKKMFLLIVLALALIICSSVYAEEYGMYVKVVEKISAPFDEVVKNTESLLAKNGWTILASYGASVPEGCGFRAHTIVINSPEYARKIAAHGPRSAFALPLRVGIFMNETGVNISFVNPASLNRTVLGDNTEKELSSGKMKDLSAILASAAKGGIVNQQIGEIRSKGYVGGMGGGAFENEIEVIYKKEDSGKVFQDTAAKVKEGVLSNKKAWRLVYSMEPDNNIVIYGIDKAATESRAFKIAGEKRESKNNRCPGIDHVAAFPIELIVYKEGGLVKVVTLDEMYRMKVYFEDAGKWAFMKNMGMPGEIEKEIKEISASKLK
jgi:uncharacterized protein (DUF302 family)